MSHNDKKSTRFRVKGSYFVTDPENPKGFGLTLQTIHDQHGRLVITSDFELDQSYEGPPFHVHGGVSAALLDEIMGIAAWNSGYQVVSASITVEYRAPVPLYQPLRMEAWVDKVEDRKIYPVGRILLADGTSAVTSTGLFIHNPKMFAMVAEAAQSNKSNPHV